MDTTASKAVYQGGRRNTDRTQLDRRDREVPRTDNILISMKGRHPFSTDSEASGPPLPASQIATRSR